MSKRLAIVIATAAIGAFAAFGAQSAAATTINVTNTNDTGADSLRAAIDEANQLAGFDRIEIEATGKIALQSPLPTVTTPMTIHGPGRDLLSLDGSAVSGATLALDPAGSCYPSRRCLVTLRGVTINHSNPAIRNRGVLNLIDSRLSDNVEGILNERRLRVIDSSVSGSGDTGIVNGWGGSGGSAVIDRSTMSGNQFAIFNILADLQVSRSTLSDNDWGIQNLSATARIDRSTLSNTQNVAIANGTFGGGGGTVHVTQSTLSGNTRAGEPGSYTAISTDGNSSTSLKSTIVANSAIGDCGGGVTSKGFNLADDASCGLTAQGDQPNTDPLLRPLADYGGPTKTFALRPESLAIDAGLAGTTPIDQRGLPRIANYPAMPKATGGDNSDIGAFELQAP